MESIINSILIEKRIYFLRRKNEPTTLAANRVDEDHISSPEEIDDLNDFLDGLDKKYDAKHRDQRGVLIE